MESETVTKVNGGAAVPNGHPSPEDQTLIQDANDGSKEDDNTVKLLYHEIQGLKDDRSELQAKLEVVLAEVEQSEAAKKSMAFHASYLEGELMRTQQDLTAASSAAEDAEAVARDLKRSVQDFEAEKALLETSKAALESQIRDLEARMVAYAALEADLVAEREKAAAADANGEEEISILELKVRNLEAQLGVSMEEKEMVVEEAKRRAARNDELEEALKELVKMNAELEGKVSGFGSSIDRDLAADQKECGGKVKEAKGVTLSWATAAGAAASIATVAAAITVGISLNARQRSGRIKQREVYYCHKLNLNKKDWL